MHRRCFYLVVHRLYAYQLTFFNQVVNERKGRAGSYNI